jgi:hypothetical protein
LGFHSRVSRIRVPVVWSPKERERERKREAQAMMMMMMRGGAPRE